MTEVQTRPSRTAAQLEAYLAERLAGRRLVCEVTLDDETLLELKLLWHGWRPGPVRVPGQIAREYPAVHLFFCVDHGIRHYEGNDFWTKLNVTAADQRRIGEGFERALIHFGLEEFRQFKLEGARRFVSVILAHGGIPASMAPRFVSQALIPAIRAGAELGADVVADWRANRPTFFPKPVARFLLQGGATAVDLLDRLIELAWAPRAEAESVARRLDVPPALASAILSLPDAAALTRGVSLPRARVTFDPYGRVGPQLVLPPLDREVAPRVTWLIDGGFGSIRTEPGFHRALVDPIELAPNGDWWTASVRLDGQVVRTDRFECFAKNPVVCFDDSWNYVTDYAGIRLDTMWIVAKQEWSFASLEADGLRPLTGDSEALRGGWRGYSATHLDLAGVATLVVLEDGTREICRLTVHSSGSEPAIIGRPLDDVIGQLGDPVFAQLPRVSMPAGRAWSLQITDPDGGVRDEAFPAVAEPRSVALGDFVEPTVGRFEVAVQGALGVGRRFSFVLVPELELDVPEAPVGPTTGVVIVRASAGPAVALHGLRPGVEAEIEVRAGDSREALWARADGHKAGLFVSVPRLRWALRDETRSDAPAQTLITFNPSDISGSDRQVMVVSAGRSDVYLSLALEAGGQEVQLDGPRRTGQSGQLTFALDDFRDSVRSNESREERFVVVTAAGRFEVARYTPAGAPRSDGASRVGREVRGKITRLGANRVEVEGDGWQGVAYVESLPRPIAEYEVGEPVTGYAVSEDQRGLKLDLRLFEPGRFPQGTEVAGRVLHASPQRLRVAVDGHDGVIYPEHLPPDRPWTSWKADDELTARVIGADRARRRIKLSMATFDDRGLHRGSPVSGAVTGHSDDRIFVVVQGLPGFVRTEEWGGSTPAAGDPFSGWVERVRRERGELEISCLAFNRLGVRVGDTIDVIAVGAAEGRLVVTLQNGESAIVPFKELPPHLRADELARRQERLQAVVTRVDPASRGIVASVRRATTSYTFGGDDDDVPTPNPFAVIRQKMRER